MPRSIDLTRSSMLFIRSSNDLTRVSIPVILAALAAFALLAELSADCSAFASARNEVRSTEELLANEIGVVGTLKFCAAGMPKLMGCGTEKTCGW